MSAVYTCLVKLLTAFLLLFTSLSANAESYYVSNNPATVSNVVEVIQGHKFIVDIAEPHPLAGNITIFLAETYSPKVETPCVKESELGVQAKEYVVQQLATAKNIKLTHYRKTSKGAIAGVSLDGLDLGQNLIQKGLASEEYDYFKAYYCNADLAHQFGHANKKESLSRAIFWFERSLVLGGVSHKRASVMFDMGGSYYDLGNYQKALEWFTKALELSPNYPNAAEELGNTNSELGNYEQAFKWWKQSAELGGSGSQAQLGHAYLHGEGTTVDLDQAEYWLTKAAEQGNDWAQSNLAEVYIRKGDTDNAQKAIEAMERLANNGDAGVMQNLGSLYDSMGNYEQAFKWFKTSAELGNRWAQASLGHAYLYGDGTTIDLDQAEYWLTKAAEQGNDWAQSNLAEVYIRKGDTDNAQKAIEAMERLANNGDAGVMQNLGSLYENMGNYEQAFKWRKQSAELGDSGAQASLGHAYLYGDGTTIDLDQAEFWLTKAAEQGNDWAQRNLIEVYKRKGDSNKANDLAQKTTEALTSKASNGDIHAMKELGDLHNDMGNKEQAFKWWKQSAELDNKWAQDNLGWLYMWGNGVPANLGLAEYWLTKAVDAGNEWAVLNLGELYVEGGSYPTALKWFNKALESSNTQLRASAMNGIGRLYQKEGDTRKSVIWWQKAAELGDSSAQSELGYAYLNGNGISRDLELAKKWLTKAAEQGEYWAIKGLAELNE